MDFKKTLKDIGKDSFVFLDPPYRGGFADYGTKKDDDFQEEVIKFLNDAAHRGAYSLLSNRDLGDDFFNIRAGNNQIHTCNVSYTVGRRKKLLNEDGEEAKDKNGNPLYQEAKKLAISHYTTPIVKQPDTYSVQPSWHRRYAASAAGSISPSESSHPENFSTFIY